MEEEGIMTTIQVCRLRFRSRQASAAVWRWSKGGKEEEEEEEEEEEGLFKADAVNEEDPERDRATQV